MDTPPAPSPICGGLAFALGGLALVTVLIAFFAGPFAAQSAATVSLGELASETAKATARDLLGLAQPAPEALPWDIDRWLSVGIALTAGLAIVLAAAAALRREPGRVAAFGAILGASAIGMQIFAWAALLLTLVLIVGLFREMFLEALGAPLTALGGLLSLFSCGG